MADVISDWAGKERLFRLNFGLVLELEEACGKDAIGAIFLRITSGRFHAADVFHVIRLALVGGGETKVEAKRLMETHFDRTPYAENAALAGDILIALMTGVEEGKADKTQEDPQPFKFSEVSQICRIFNVSPLEMREMSYADFVNMLRGYNASAQQKAEPPTPEEFEDILARYEPSALK